jgi:hypothetical protein
MSGAVQTYPTTLVYTDTDFRSQFPAYESEETYPEAMLEQCFTTATMFISDYNAGDMTGSVRQTAIYLMMVHLLQLQAIAAGSTSGAGSGLQTSSKIRDVAITWQVPPVRSQWAWWLGQTGGGQMLLALLSKASVGGFYVGGACGRTGFRGGMGGGFGGRF